MEQIIVQSIEQMINNKIQLYNDLFHCFKQERDFLINIDLDKLWSISREKEQICKKIYSVRQKIAFALDPMIKQKTNNKNGNSKFDVNQILDLIPRESKSVFHNSFLKLNGLKREIEKFKKENMDFINDSLRFLDDLMIIITGADESNGYMAYNKKSCLNKKYDTNIILSREV